MTPKPARTVCWTAILLLLAAGSRARSGQMQPVDAGRPRTDDAPALETTESEHTANFLGLRAAPIDEPLVTDRPDFTESTLTIPAGRVQLEAGYTFTYDSGDGSRTQDHTYPELLFRIGLAEELELRLGWTGWSHVQEAFRERNDDGRRLKLTEHDDGGGDMSIGFKVHLLDQQDWVPDFGIIIDADVPTGAEGFTSGDFDPAIRFLWAYDLAEDLSVAGNVNFAWPTSDRGRYFETSTSLALGYGITDEVGAYIEYYGFYPGDRNNADSHFINTGLTYLITNNFQIDIRVGMGLNDEADDFFSGAGFAWRF